MSDDRTIRAVDQYCGRLRKALRAVPSAERDEIVAEVRVHLLERIESEGHATEEAVGRVIGAAGVPEELAREYEMQAMLRPAATARSTWLLLRTTARWARTGGAGIGAFFTPTAYGTRLAEGKETRRIGDRDYVLEYPIHADYALIKADRADRWGNLTYRKSARNFGPIMAAAARISVVQVRETVELGELDPEQVVTPGIFVKRVVKH